MSNLLGYFCLRQSQAVFSSGESTCHTNNDNDNNSCSESEEHRDDIAIQHSDNLIGLIQVPISLIVSDVRKDEENPEVPSQETSAQTNLILKK